MSEQDIDIRGLVLFCDGGARPTNPGFAGWGIHGYHYIAKPGPLKGLGLGGVYATNRGYKEKDPIKVFTADQKKEYYTALSKGTIVPVQPYKYVDAFGTAGQMASSNIAELHAITNVMDYILQLSKTEEAVQYVCILADSEYVIKGIKERMQAWHDNNWLKRDMTPVANMELWKNIKKRYDAIQALGIAFHIEYIEAHKGHIGNESADGLATIGVYQTMHNGLPQSWKISEAETYWKSTSKKHPFIFQKKCYFNTFAESQTSNLSSVRYYLGDHGVDDDHFGKRQSDTGFSVIQLQSPEPLIEYVKSLQAKYSNNADSIFAVNLSTLYTDEVYKSIERFGEASFLPPNGYRLDIKYFDSSPITREFKPAMLARRGVQDIEELDGVLTKFLNKDPSLSVTEVTSYFYDVVETKPKKGAASSEVKLSTKLKTSLGVGTSSIDIEIRPHVEDVTTSSNEETKTPNNVKITLTFGIDVPDRNTFKRLEEYTPKVYVVTWKTSDYAYRYATIIQEGDNLGIWGGIYSNLKILP